VLVHLRLLALIALSSLAAVAGSAEGQPHGAAKKRRSPTLLVITLQVPNDKTPEWVCVVSRNECPASTLADRSCVSRPLGSVGMKAVQENGISNLLRNAGWKPAVEDARYLPTEMPGGLPTKMSDALSAIGHTDRNPDNVCEREGHDGCLPSVALHHYEHHGTFGGALTCGGNDSGSGRVLFLRLETNPVDTELAVTDVKVHGNVVNVVYAGTFADGSNTVVQTIGGDYAYSEETAVDIKRSVLLRLHPRCTKYVAELPGNVARISQVVVSGQTCMVPYQDSPRSLAVQVPYNASHGVDKMRVIYANGDVSEATWTESLPQVPFSLGVRTLRFSWRPPSGCLGDAWPKQPPLPRWSGHCPRATLTDIDRTCVLEPARENPPRSCDYTCEIPDHLDAHRLPLAVRFDRIRAIDESAPPASGRAPREILYSWTDKILHSGQRLDSSVDAEDRRLFLELDPSEWKQRAGDRIYSIRIVSPGGTWSQVEIDSTDRGEAPPRWFSFPAPGLRCPAQLRVAIFGTRSYREQAIDVERGTITLKRPQDYRRQIQPHFTGGPGFTWWSSEPITYGTAGLGFHWYPASPQALYVEVEGQVARTSFVGISRTDKPGERSRVMYSRFGVRLGYERWWFETMHLGAAAGVWMGVPFDHLEQVKVDTNGFSFTAEGTIAQSIGSPHVWLVAAPGLRLSENRNTYATDFVGQPTANPSRDTDVFVDFRLRVKL
jgi:hypothetical protein